MRRFLLIPLVLILIFAIAACGSQDDEPSANDTYDISIGFTPDPPMIGDANILITLVDGDGDTINDARISILATHNTASERIEISNDSVINDGEGTYTIPFQFTLEGEWQVAATAVLDDGETFTELSTVTVGLLETD